MSYRNKFLVILVSTVLVFYSVVGGLLGRDGGGDGYAPLSIFIEVLGKIQGVYVEDPNLSKVMHGALLGLLESLDPYSTYLTAEEYRRYRKTRTSARLYPGHSPHRRECGGGVGSETGRYH